MIMRSIINLLIFSVMARWLRESGQLLTYDWKKNSQKKEIIKSPDT